MKIVIACDSFKEALSAKDACEAVARGVRRAKPDATLDLVPLADGGEGTVTTLVAATGGTLHESTVTGPLGEPVRSTWGMLGEDRPIAVIEMAAASGLMLVPVSRRNPLLTTTYGTGELILAAVGAGAREIIIGIGGSATTDGGAGAAQAAGVRFFDGEQRLISTRMTGGTLDDIARIDVSTRDPRIATTTIRTACDVDNPLCGPRGAAAVYSPQKGATPDQVGLLERNLAHLANLVRRNLQIEVRDLPGAGAAGGLGAGLVAFFGAKLQPGIRIVMEAVRLAERIADADLVITGEGRLDRQSVMGKVIAGVGQAAKAASVPVIALAGCLGEGADQTLAVLRSYHPINPPGTPIAEALPRTAERLEVTAAAVLSNWPLSH
ncbi:MAG TPA: glycerate kinase [Phycisphaerae bacterium]|nr:glycerate kinase [Phycisphaerae bacterium]